MPKFRLLVDIDSMVEEGEHLEDIFADGIEAETEEDAERIDQSERSGWAGEGPRRRGRCDGAFERIPGG